jgi:hypothetical protein
MADIVRSYQAQTTVVTRSSDCIDQVGCAFDIATRAGGKTGTATVRATGGTAYYPVNGTTLARAYQASTTLASQVTGLSYDDWLSVRVHLTEDESWTTVSSGWQQGYNAALASDTLRPSTMYLWFGREGWYGTSPNGEYVTNIKVLAKSNLRTTMGRGVYVDETVFLIACGQPDGLLYTGYSLTAENAEYGSQHWDLRVGQTIVASGDGYGSNLWIQHDGVQTLKCGYGTTTLATYTTSTYTEGAWYVYQLDDFTVGAIPSGQQYTKTVRATAAVGRALTKQVRRGLGVGGVVGATVTRQTRRTFRATASVLPRVARRVARTVRVAASVVPRVTRRTYHVLRATASALPRVTKRLARTVRVTTANLARVTREKMAGLYFVTVRATSAATTRVSRQARRTFRASASVVRRATRRVYVLRRAVASVAPRVAKRWAHTFRVTTAALGRVTAQRFGRIYYVSARAVASVAARLTKAASLRRTFRATASASTRVSRRTARAFRATTHAVLSVRRATTRTVRAVATAATNVVRSVALHLRVASSVLARMFIDRRGLYPSTRRLRASHGPARLDGSDSRTQAMQGSVEDNDLDGSV